MKVEAKVAAAALRAAGYDVFSAGYGKITVRLKADDAGYTCITTAEANALLAA